MKEILTYILGVVVCSGLFTAFYRTVMHRRTSFRTARVFLLGSLVLAAIIPALEIPVWRVAPIEIPAATLEQVPAATATAPFVATPPVPPADWLAVALWTLYGTGLTLLAGTMFFQAVRIARIRRRSEIHKVNGCEIAVSEEIVAPFSFLATVFVERGTSAEEMRQIVLHESSHIRHRHSAEKITMEVLKMLLWFNPFAWWASRLLGEVHEFEADRDVLDGGFSAEQYLPLIFRQIFGYIPEISTGLGHSLTKKRFEMMKKFVKHTKYSWLRAAGVLPIAAGMLALFGFTDRAPEIIVQQPDETISDGGVVLNHNLKVTFDTITLVNVRFEDHDRKEITAKEFVESNPEYTVVEKEDEVTLIKKPEPDEPLLIVDTMPVFADGDLNNFRHWVMNRLVYPSAAMKDNIAGKVIAKFIVEKDGNVNPAVEIVSSPSRLLSDELVRVIASSPAWTPGMLDGKPTRVAFIIPVEFASLVAPDDALPEMRGKRVFQTIVKIVDEPDEPAIAIEVQEEEEMVETGLGKVKRRGKSTSTQKVDMSQADKHPDLRSYIQGRVTSAEFVGDQLILRGQRSLNGPNEALILIDGVPAGSFAEVNMYLNPNDIESITVSGPTPLYGIQGANGVLVIKTKKQVR